MAVYTKHDERPFLGKPPPEVCNYCGEPLDDALFVYWAFCGKRITEDRKVKMVRCDPESIEQAQSIERIAGAIKSEIWEGGPNIALHWKCAEGLGKNLIADSGVCRWWRKEYPCQKGRG